MKVILQIGVVFGVCLIGEAAACFLPFPFPASVLSMIFIVSAAVPKSTED